MAELPPDTFKFYIEIKNCLILKQLYGLIRGLRYKNTKSYKVILI